MEAKASAGEARGLGEENARDLLEFTPVHMDWAEDRHFAEIFSLKQDSGDLFTGGGKSSFFETKIVQNQSLHKSMIFVRLIIHFLILESMTLLIFSF